MELMGAKTGAEYADAAAAVDDKSKRRGAAATTKAAKADDDLIPITGQTILPRSPADQAGFQPVSPASKPGVRAFTPLLATLALRTANIIIIIIMAA